LTLSSNISKYSLKQGIFPLIAARAAPQYRKPAQELKQNADREIIDSILLPIENNGTSGTHIMYRTYLSYSQMKGFLVLLE
jgi:hypothetical protein